MNDNLETVQLLPLTSDIVFKQADHSFKSDH